MESDRPDIIAPPPLAWAAALVAAIGLGGWLPLGLLPAFPWIPGIVAGAAVISLALWVNLSGAAAFLRTGTSINPYRPARTLVRDGAFRYTRNPMYLGMILSVAGYGLVASNLWGPVAALLLWAVLHHGVVLPEERYLEARFGDAYRALMAATRRWL